LPPVEGPTRPVVRPAEPRQRPEEHPEPRVLPERVPALVEEPRQVLPVLAVDVDPEADLELPFHVPERAHVRPDAVEGPASVRALSPQIVDLLRAVERD